MIRSTLPLFAFALAASAPALAQQPIPLGHFDSVRLRGGGEITFVPSAVQRVVLLAGSADFTRFHVDRTGKLQIDACNDRCPRNYSLRIRIETPRIPNTAIDGGGAISAAPGFAPQGKLAVAINGGGTIDLRTVPVSNAQAAVNGGGEIKLQSRDLLTAAVSGGGAVHYWGNPQVMTAINGGGTVERVR